MYIGVFYDWWFINIAINIKGNMIHAINVIRMTYVLLISKNVPAHEDTHMLTQIWFIPANSKTKLVERL